MNVIIEIEGREAIPVRAIPLLTNWGTMRSDTVAKALAWDDHFYHFEGLQAFRLNDGRVTAIPATYWGNVVRTRLEALSDKIRAVAVSQKAGLDEWRSASLKALPAGAFVWRDEFEPRHCARYTHSMSYVKNIVTMEFMGSEEQERRTQLDYSPFDAGMVDQAFIMEGFEPQATIPSLAPTVTRGDGTDQAPDPERRLARLRALGGTAKYARGEWKFKGIVKLAASEKAERRKRSDQKTIRADLKDAAQTERDWKSAGFGAGLGQR